MRRFVLFTMLLIGIAGCIVEPTPSPKKEQQETKKEAPPVITVPDTKREKEPEVQLTSMLELDILSGCLDSAGISETEDAEPKPDWMKEIQKEAPTAALSPIDEFLAADDAFDICRILSSYENHDPKDPPLPPLPKKFTVAQATELFTARLKRFEAAMVAALNAKDPLPHEDKVWNDGMYDGRDFMAITVIEHLIESKKKPEALGLTIDDIKTAYKKGIQERFAKWQKEGSKTEGHLLGTLCDAISGDNENAPKDHGLSTQNPDKTKTDKVGSQVYLLNCDLEDRPIVPTPTTPAPLP